MNIDPEQIIGRRVKWRTSSYCHKNGIARTYIPAYSVPSRLYPELHEVSGGCNKLDNGIHGISEYDRILIEVERVGAKGQALLSHWYGPRVGSVIEVEEPSNG